MSPYQPSNPAVDFDLLQSSDAVSRLRALEGEVLAFKRRILEAAVRSASPRLTAGTVLECGVFECVAAKRVA